MQPAVSVIMPTYNRADYLKRSVQSVLDQTFTDFEIILINNYSTDDTLNVVSAFNDRRIKVIDFKNDGIIAKSRNRGIKQSTGKYIAFLDDDDLWCPDKLELQIKYMESHPEFGLVYSNAIVIDEHESMKDLRIDPKQAKTGQVFPDLLYENFIPILTVLMRRVIFETNGPLNEDSCIRGAEDYEYWLRAALKFDFGYIDEPLALYRVHGGCVSGTVNRPLLRQKVRHSFINNPEVPEKYHSEIILNIERVNADISVYYWSVSDKKNARTYAQKYILSNLKKIKLLNSFVGIVLLLLVNFRYDRLMGFVECVAKMRRPLRL